jgi:hypothetical protein
LDSGTYIERGVDGELYQRYEVIKRGIEGSMYTRKRKREGSREGRGSRER